MGDFLWHRAHRSATINLRAGRVLRRPASPTPRGFRAMWSLIRTILAVLNVLGAIAFLFFAAKDYGVRQSWAYANVLYDVAEQGLPLDENETNAEGEKIVTLLGKAGKDQLYDNKPGPSYQLEEVKRFKSTFDGAIA